MSVFIDNGDAGTWADMLANSPCVRVLPDLPLQGPLDASQGGGEIDPAFARDVLRLHSAIDTPGAQDNRA